MALFTNVMDFLDDHAPVLLDHYFNSGCFAGGHFETHAGGGDRDESRNRFTDDDVVAVKLLGVEIPPEATLALLQDRDRRFAHRLARVPTDISLTAPSAKGLISPESSASILWDEVHNVPGIGWVAAHMLCARKRPRLLPVYDGVLEDALRPSQDAYWLPLWETLQNWAVVERLETLRRNVGPSRVSLLRILDVSVWMRHCPAVVHRNPCRCQGIY